MKFGQRVSPEVTISSASGDSRFGQWQLEQLLGRNSLGELYLAKKSGVVNVAAGTTGATQAAGAAGARQEGGKAGAAQAPGEAGEVGALRSLDSSLARNSRLTKRFLQEAEKASSLNHANIARILDFGQAEDGTAFMVRQFVDGHDLQMLSIKGALPFEKAVKVAASVCDALSEAAKYDVLHRNLLPSNVLLDKNDLVRVVDFGITKTFPREGREAMGATNYDSHRDDKRYFSPEQIKEETLDIRSDIYSLGCIMHLLFTGEQVFAGVDGYRMLQSKTRGQVDTSVFQNIVFDGAEKDRRRMAENAATVVQRAISGDKKLRYQSPQELKEDLNRLAQGSTLQQSTIDAVKNINSLNEFGVASENTSGKFAESVHEVELHSVAQRRADFVLSVSILLLSAAALLFAVHYSFGGLLFGDRNRSSEILSMDDAGASIKNDEYMQFLPGVWDIARTSGQSKMLINAVYVINGNPCFTGLITSGKSVEPMIGHILGASGIEVCSLNEHSIQTIRHLPGFRRAGGTFVCIGRSDLSGHTVLSVSKSASQDQSLFAGYQIQVGLVKNLQGPWRQVVIESELPSRFYLKPHGNQGIFEIHNIDKQVPEAPGDKLLGLVIIDDKGTLIVDYESTETTFTLGQSGDTREMDDVNGAVAVNESHTPGARFH